MSIKESRSMWRPRTTRQTVRGVAKTRPIGPQSIVQNVAARTTATGDRPVLWPWKIGSMTWDRLHDQEKETGCNQHRPARIDGGGQREGEHRRDDRADVGYEAEHRRQNAPQRGAGN